MLVELEKDDVVALIKGTSPTYDLMKDPVIAQLGYYTGGFRDDWRGLSQFPDLSKEALYSAYTKLKEH